MKTTTVVNGFEITENVSEVLGNWSKEDYPKMYATYLGDIQDFLCRLLIMNPEYDDTVKEALGNIICIKDDLKKFAKED